MAIVQYIDFHECLRCVRIPAMNLNNNPRSPPPPKCSNDFVDSWIIGSGLGAGCAGVTGGLSACLLCRVMFLSANNTGRGPLAVISVPTKTDDLAHYCYNKTNIHF